MATETQADAPDSDSYWAQTRQPLPCLVFLIPLLTLYEIGLLWAARDRGDTELVQNGADSWMRQAIEQLGFSPAFVLPIIILFIFVVWQVHSRATWRLDGEVIAGMFGESVVLAVALMVVGRMQDMAFSRMEAQHIAASLGDSGDTLQRVVAYVGAGIYEETLFRLLLLPAIYFTVKAIGVPSSMSMAFAMTLSALAFSGAHYIGPTAESFVWFSFIFRWLAGLFFAGVFVMRGFGIAVGAHAAYDILVGVLHFQL